MFTFIQQILLQLYKFAVRIGLTRTAIWQEFFYRTYMFYKSNIEARHTDYLQQFVPQGATVIDVGANIGFFARKFGQWVGQNGKVIAIEPEINNVKLLQRGLQRAGLNAVVEVIHAAATETDGEISLVVDPYHPANHRIGQSAVKVPARAIDSLTAQLNTPVTLIKIDVQGAEAQVLAGAKATLRRDKPVIFIEIDAGGLHNFGSTAEGLIQGLVELGYQAHILDKAGISAALTTQQALDIVNQQSYADFVFIAPKPDKH
jgi:FkbM family methyltransferase